MKKVVIIGVGKIAGGNKNNYKSSHAYYYNQNSNYHLVACVDKNNQRLIKFQSKWNVKYKFKSIDNLISSNLQFDIVDVCLNVSNNINLLNKILRLNSKLFLIEKPFLFNPKLIKQIFLHCKKNKKNIYINYPRIYYKYFNRFAINFNSKNNIKLNNIIFYYSNGLENNCSHFLIVLIKYFRDLKLLKNSVIKKNSTNYDFSLVANKKIIINFISISAKKLSLFEGTLIYNNKIISFIQNEEYLNIRKISQQKNLNSDYEIKATKNINIKKYKKINQISDIFSFINSTNNNIKNRNEINNYIVKLSKLIYDIKNNSYTI